MKQDDLIITGHYRFARGWLPWIKVMQMEVERVVIRKNGAIERTKLWVKATPDFRAWI